MSINEIPEQTHRSNPQSEESQVTITDDNSGSIKLRLPFLRHIAIESKLKFGFSILMAIVVIISCMSVFGLQYVKDHYDHAIEFGLKLEQLSLEAEKAHLQARLSEKDFLLLWKSYGVESAKEQYINQFESALGRLIAICDEIKRMLPDDGSAGNRALRDSSDLLKKELNLYEAKFNEIVHLITIQGSKDSGLEGTFIKDAQTVEASVHKAGLEHAEVLLLTLRRYEKDFLMRNDKGYVKNVSDTLLLLVQDIEKSTLVNKEKETLKLYLDDYWKTFDKLVDVRLELERKIEDFEAVVIQIDDATENFREMGKDEANQYLDDAHTGTEKTKLLIYSSLSILFIIALLLSWLLASHIKTPLSLLDKTVKRVQDGDLQAKAPIITSDETGRLASAFNDMNASLNDAMADIKEKSHEIDIQRKLSEDLLRNILPKTIANRLKEEETIAEWHGQVTVLFADIVGFTKLSSVLSATELVSRLNKIFFLFDEITEKHGLEKIKTMGDCYMVAGGLPVASEDHAERVADFALELIPALEKMNQLWTHKLQIRIGINTGPVVAGVIGKSKFVYDLWGDTVNIASRMESHGVNDAIQVSESTYQLLKELYTFEARGAIQIKGRGEMSAYFMRSRK